MDVSHLGCVMTDQSISNSPSTDLYQIAAELIYSADTLLITAGAGFGVDSGLPDFRGEDGFYTAYPQFKLSRRPLHKVATPNFFIENPRRAWGFYAHRYHLYQRTDPHLGYAIVNNWLALKGGFVVTTNVDGHFIKSGLDRLHLLEDHGSINHLQCFRNCNESIYKVVTMPIVEECNLSAVGNLPLCPFCGGPARPNILMFNDYHWNSARTDAQKLRYSDWFTKYKGNKIVVIEIGAGIAIPTLRHLLSNRTRIRINPHDCEAPLKGIGIKEGAERALMEIDKKLRLLMGS